MKTFADFGIEIPPGREGQIRTTCPKCSPTRRKKYVQCLSVNTEDNSWYCHHCHWNGRLGQEGAFHHDSWLPKEYRKPVYEKGDLTEKALAWLTEKRKISEGVLVRNQIGSNDVYFRVIEGFLSAIQFPYFRDDQLINIKNLAYYPNPQGGTRERAMRLEGGAERIPYGLNDVIGCKEIIWVEGELDKLSVETAGKLNCISVPNGAPDPKTKNCNIMFEFLETCSDYLDPVKRHILAVDNDKPGKILEEELARRLGPEKCALVEWPEGCKDANDVLVQRGPDALAKCLQQAKDYPVSGIFTVDDISPRIQALYTTGYDLGASTGWKRVDVLYRVRPGEWTVVTGSPGCGKSEFVDALVSNLAESLGWSFGVFSPESAPLERHFAKLTEKRVGKPFSKFEVEMNGVETVSPAELEEAKHWLNKHFYFILPDDEEDQTLGAILDKARVLVARKGIRGLVIDPWTEVTHARKGNQSETEYIGQCLSRIGRFARTYGVHIWIVAHPVKQKKYQNKDGEWVFADVDLYDISGSANWYNKAFYGITLHRLPDRNAIKLIVRKVRFKEVGKLGQCFLDYNLLNGRFEEKSQQGAAAAAAQKVEDDFRGEGDPFDDIEKSF